MTEQASVLWRVILRERVNTFRTMTVHAELFRLFLFHGHKAFVVIIMGQFSRCLGWCAPQKDKKPGTEGNKEQVVDKNFLFTVHISLVLDEEKLYT